MGREARTVKIDPQFAKRIAELLTPINTCLARVQLNVILHQRDGQPIADEAREQLDRAVDALLKLQALFTHEGARSC